MPRPREFDDDEVLESAMLAFLERGMERTSMRHLEAVTGVKQVSLYNAFGSKEGLFLAVFDHYVKICDEIQGSYLDNRGLDGIEAFVKAIVTPKSPMPQSLSGCLVVNTALAEGAGGAVIKGRVQDDRAAMRARLVAALRRARQNGTLKPALNLNQCAEFLVTTIWGIFITIRLAGDDQRVGQPAARVLVATLRSWSVPTTASA